ncbi:BL1S1 protein, partial [Geococcyx californianus]|nr:BL1S1 protein [Geococcyx californianus]
RARGGEVWLGGAITWRSRGGHVAQGGAAMLSRLLKEHQARQSERRELQAERRRREAIAAATRLTEALVDHLNVGVAQAYVNQRKLDQEVKTLQAQAAQFARQTGQWISMVENFNQALKVGPPH